MNWRRTKISSALAISASLLAVPAVAGEIQWGDWEGSFNSQISLGANWRMEDMEPRLVTVNDLYAFDPNAKVSIDPFEDIIGRHFKTPKAGLGNDNSPSAHMWRTLANPDAPL